MKVMMMVICAVATVQAQESARQLALSSDGTIDRRVHAGEFNPGLLGSVTNWTVGVSVLPSRFGIPDLATTGGIIGGPAIGGGVALTVVRTSSAPAQHLRIRTSAGWNIIGPFHLGVSAELRRWSFDRYPPVHQWSFLAGVQYRDDALWSCGEVELGPIGESKDDVGITRLNLGWRLPFGQGTSAFAEIIADRNWPLSYRYGCEVELVEWVSMLGSWSQGPDAVGGGILVAVGGVDLLTAANWNVPLGWSLGIDVMFTRGVE